MTEVILTVMVAGVLAAWFVLTVIHHLPCKAFDTVRAADKLMLLPRWNFFAPQPGISDFHVLVRDQLVDGSASAWQQLEVPSPRRTVLSSLWHPGKRGPKALFDTVTTLLVMTSNRSIEARLVPFSLPYLMLLNAVSSLPRSPFTVGRQFMLVKTDGLGAWPDVLFVSNVHEL